ALGGGSALRPPMEAAPPGAGPRRPSSTPGGGPTAEAGGDPATAVGAPGRGGAGSGGLRHEPVDVPADRRRHPSPVQGGLPSGSRRATAAGVWLQSAAAPAAREGARRSSRTRGDPAGPAPSKKKYRDAAATRAGP